MSVKPLQCFLYLIFLRSFSNVANWFPSWSGESWSKARDMEHWTFWHLASCVLVLSSSHLLIARLTFNIIFITRWSFILDFQISPNFDIHGVLMISLALVADAIIGNVQEKTIKQYNASNSEVGWGWELGLHLGDSNCFLPRLFCSATALVLYIFSSLLQYSLT